MRINSGAPKSAESSGVAWLKPNHRLFLRLTWSTLCFWALFTLWAIAAVIEEDRIGERGLSADLSQALILGTLLLGAVLALVSLAYAVVSFLAGGPFGLRLMATLFNLTPVFLDVMVSGWELETPVDIALSLGPAISRRRAERWTRRKGRNRGAPPRPRSET
jgi:hypothetical protein